MDGVRIDKWLWAARLHKSRALAQDAIEGGRVLVAGERVKPARLVRVGERLAVGRGDEMRELIVRGLSERRGPAPLAQALYEETPASVARRAQAAERRRLFDEPARSIVEGRPSKRDRRLLERWRGS